MKTLEEQIADKELEIEEYKNIIHRYSIVKSRWLHKGKETLERLEKELKELKEQN